MSQLIAKPTIGDLSTLTASDEVATAPATNLLRMQPSEFWRSSGLSSLYLVSDLGSAQAVGLVWLGHTNATGAAQFRVRGATSEANLTAAPGYDSGLLDIWEYADMEARGFTKFHATHIPASAQTFRWWRVDITDAANPDGYFQAGRLIISDPWRPTRGIQFGFNPPGPAGRSEIQEAEGGGFFVNERPAGQVSEFVIRLEDAKLAEVDSEIAALDRLIGDRGDILVILQTDQITRIAENTIHGVQTNLRGPISPTYNIREKRFTIKGFPS